MYASFTALNYGSLLADENKLIVNYSCKRSVVSSIINLNKLLKFELVINKHKSNKF